MADYKFLEHASDLLIQGEGPDLSSAVVAVAHGLFKSITRNISSFSDISYIEFSESGVDVQDLVVNIFTRVLAEMDCTGRLACRFELLAFDEELNTATIKLGLCEGNAKLSVKAVTFHDFKIRAANGITTLTVLFDI